MKGIILSGGLGTRLRPLTYVTHKHLLPVYNKVMVEIPLATLTRAGIKDIMVVTGEENAGQYVNFLGNGGTYGCNIVYGFQSEPGGIAQAIGVAKEFCKGEKIAVILGDNYFEDDISAAAEAFIKQDTGAKVFLYEVEDPRRYGVARFEGDKVVEILEKPENPPSNFMVTGLYMFDSRAFDFIDELKPSARGELEVTDLNNKYIQDGTMTFEKLSGKWFDMGTFDSLLEGAQYLKSKEQK